MITSVVPGQPKAKARLLQKARKIARLVIRNGELLVWHHERGKGHRTERKSSSLSSSMCYFFLDCPTPPPLRSGPPCVVGPPRVHSMALGLHWHTRSTWGHSCPSGHESVCAPRMLFFFGMRRGCKRHAVVFKWNWDCGTGLAREMRAQRAWLLVPVGFFRWHGKLCAWRHERASCACWMHWLDAEASPRHAYVCYRHGLPRHAKSASVASASGPPDPLRGRRAGGGGISEF